MPARNDLGDAVQDYLKEIHKLQEKDGRATTSALAEAIEVSPPSASGMIKKLAALGLVEHTPYRGVTLTDAGEMVALEMIRHHRLIEQYLAETLGLPIHQLHDEADRLEHALSEDLEARIDAVLGHPTHDPHGDPIPDPELTLLAEPIRPLASLGEGDEATVRRVPDGDADLLRYLSEIGLVPGCQFKLRSIEPFNGPITLALDGNDRVISQELATRIGVA